MYRSIDLSYSEKRPDHSRYAYNISASYFTPAPADIELDNAIANFAALGLNGIGGMTGPLPNYSGSLDDAYNHSSNGSRVQDPPYQGVYAGSVADSYYAQGSVLPLKAVDYPRSVINGGYGGRSRVSSSRHHSSRKPRYGGSSAAGISRPYHQDLPPIDDSRALVKYAASKKSKLKPKRKSYHSRANDYNDEDVSVVPEDSISQVSSERMSSRRDDETRGRARRRDGSVVSRSTVVAGPGVGMGMGMGAMGVGGSGGGGRGFVEPEVYYTREVTPW